MKKCLCLCLVLLLGLSALGAYAEESAFGELRYTLPEGWTETAAEGVMMLAYDGGAENDNGSVMMLTQDMSMFAGAGLDTPMMAEMYLGVLIESIFQTIGREFPENSSSSVSIDGQTAVRYAMQVGDNFVDSLAILYGQTAYVLIGAGFGDAALNGYEELVASLNFGGAAEADAAADDPLAELDDGDALALRRRVADALGVEDISVEKGKYVAGEDFPAGEYLFTAKSTEDTAILRIEEREETYASADGWNARCTLREGDAVEITGEAWLTPYPITIPSGEVQGVGHVNFLLPPTWTPSMEDGLFYAYTEEDHGAASCGRLLFAVNTLPDSDVADPEALLRYLATSDEDATMTKLFMTEVEGRPAVRYACVDAETSLSGGCTEGMYLLDGNDLYTFLIVGQDNYQEAFAYGFDLLLDTVTFEGIEPLPELSMEMELDELSEGALRRLYTLCQLSLARRDAYPSLQLPTGYFMVGVDIPAGTYSASSSGMCVIGNYDYVLMGGDPEPVTLEDGQVIQLPYGGGATFTAQ